MTDLIFSCTFIKLVFMAGRMPYVSLFLLCKNLTVSEKEAGIHSFKKKLVLASNQGRFPGKSDQFNKKY